MDKSKKIMLDSKKKRGKLIYKQTGQKSMATRKRAPQMDTTYTQTGGIKKYELKDV